MKSLAALGAALVLLFGATWALARPETLTAYQAYRALQRDLVSGFLTPDTVEGARNIFPEESAFLSSLEGLLQMEEDPRLSRNTLLLAKEYLTAYYDFIHLPASADVLYTFLEDQQVLIDASMETTDQASLMGWGWAYLAQGAVYGYQATGESRFAELFAKGARVAMESTDQARGVKDAFNREHLIGWGLNDGGKVGREITLAGRIISPIIQMGLAVQEKGGVSDQLRNELTSMAAEAASILKPYLDEQIIEGDQHYYRSLWTGEHEAMNHMAVFAEACAVAYKLTGDQAFADFPVGFRNYFKAHTHVDEAGVYTWPYQVLAEGQHGEPFWKGAITVSSMANMDEAGIELPEGAKDGMLMSFSRKIVRTNFTVHAYMDDTDFPLTAYNSARLGTPNSVGFTQFLRLDGWSPGSRAIVLDTIAYRSDLFPMGILMSCTDAVGYGHMLKYPGR